MLTLTRIAGLPYALLLQLRLQEGETSAMLRERFQKILEQEEVLKRGLAFSSHTLLQLLPRYQHKKRSDFRKKEFQIERALLQYLSRAAAKTSPFSSFATIELSGYDNPKNNPTPELGGGAGRGFVFYFLQNILRTHQLGAQNEAVQLNPTLRRKKKEFTCLVNRNNNEGIETIEANDGLAFFCDLLKTEFPDGTSVKNLTERAAFLIDETPENVFSFLEQLLDLGILEWRDSLKPDWKRLSQKFDAISDLREVAMWIHDFIQYIETQVIDIEQVNLLYQRLKIIYHDATDDELYFRPEELIYDSSPIRFVSTPTESRVGEELLPFFSLLQPYHFDPMKEAVLLFFKENYFKKNKKNNAITLLDFYENFYKNRPSVETQQDKNETLRANWMTFLEQKACIDQDGDVCLSIEDFEWANRSLAPQFLHPASDTLASIHVFLQKAGDDYVVNGSSMGFGKQFAKTISLENRYKNKKKSELWVENRDASFFNGNQHFSVLAHEIWSAGSKNTVPNAQQISVAELKIRYDAAKDALELKYKNKKVKVLDFGLEPPEHRSPMYQLLNCFGVTCPSITLIKKLQTRNSNLQTYQPRIYLETLQHRFILRRRTWWVEPNALPFLRNQEDEMVYFERVRAWKTELNLPNPVFITLSDRNEVATPQSRDDYKPQYIDFESPLFVNLFGRLLKRVVLQLKIEEMLPDETMMEGGLVKEIVVEI